MMSCVAWVEARKDFFIAIGALLSPFAAVLIGLISSKWQAAALLRSTRMQIRASALRDYRQRNVEKLREEIAAEIFYVSELRFKQQDIGLHDPKAQELVCAARGLLVSGDQPDRLVPLQHETGESAVSPADS